MLEAAGLTVERHSAHFAHDCPDEEWLRAVGERRWIAITHNKRIRYTPNEIEAVLENGVALLVVVGKAALSELALNFVSTAPRIFAFLVGHRPPLIAKVHRPTPKELERNPATPGTISLWYPKGGGSN